MTFLQGVTMSNVELPEPPAGTGTAGQALWDSILESYELVPHELVGLLAQAIRVADRIDQLEAVVDREGAMIEDPKRKMTVPHPALVEARQQRLGLARLIVAMRLPDLDSGRRPQRRGIRGAYRPRLVGGDGAA